VFIIMGMRWPGCVAWVGETRQEYKVVVRKPPWIDIIWGHRHRWENAKVIIRE
jgi:hypothetical protein